MKLEGRVAIVTGAARGLGRTYALGMAREGANILAVDLARQAEPLEETVRQVADLGRTAIACAADVASEADTARMAKEAVATLGKMDILVNNAGIYHGLTPVPFDQISLEEWNRVMTVNVTGSWLCAKAVIPQMRKQGKGKIINVSSGLALSGRGSIAHYITSKAAVIGLTRALAREVGKDGINVNAVALGLTMTEASWLYLGSEENARRAVQDKSIPRLQQPEDVVGTVVYLASDDSDFLTGQTIVVDGGGLLH